MKDKNENLCEIRVDGFPPTATVFEIVYIVWQVPDPHREFMYTTIQML